MRAIARKLIVTGGLFFAMSPVYLLLGAWFSPNAPLLTMPAPVCFCLAALLCSQLSPRRRLPIALVVCAALSGLYTAICFEAFGARALAMLLPCWLSVWLLLPAFARPDGSEWQQGFWYWGAAIHLLSRLAARLMGVDVSGLPMSTAFLIYFVYMLLSLNALNARVGVGGTKPPRRLSVRNRLAVLLLGAGAIIAANLNAVRAALDAAWQAVLSAIAAIIAFLSNLMPAKEITPGGGGGGQDMGMLSDEITEPSTFMRILEMIAKIIALAACAALALLALWFLGKKLLKLLKKLLALMRAYAARVGDSCEDTVESLFDWSEVAASAREKARKLLARKEKPQPWSALDNRARVRRAFATLKKRRPKVSETRTARELLVSGALPVEQDAAERMADIYDAARYSGAPVSGEDAQYMKEQSKL